ncbi:hypothetical protein [Vagococcus xieshaowenii]|uniref:hypothetical protein n=1 Tax=Vagococcus xieshaowenii TaxID=2562451 RepID=UPI0014326A17|nr:hypothetical protein [Vagococcus xieshaowenii]
MVKKRNTLNDVGWLLVLMVLLFLIVLKWSNEINDSERQQNQFIENRITSLSISNLSEK